MGNSWKGIIVGVIILSILIVLPIFEKDDKYIKAEINKTNIENKLKFLNADLDIAEANYFQMEARNNKKGMKLYEDKIKDIKNEMNETKYILENAEKVVIDKKAEESNKNILIKAKDNAVNNGSHIISMVLGK